MMPPWAFAQARKDAPIHVQIYALNDASDRQKGNIDGRIVRIFRNKGFAIYPGRRVVFDVPVIDPHPDPSCPPVLGGPIALDGESLAASRWLEGFFETGGGAFDLVRSQIWPIRHLTWRPVCPAGFEGVVFAGNLSRKQEMT